MIKTFTIPFKILNVAAGDIEEFIGEMPGSGLDGFSEIYEKALEKAAKVCRIASGYHLFSEIAVTKKNVIVNGTLFSTGGIIANQLKGSSGIAIFVCTAGLSISDLSKEATASNDGVMAYLYDLIGSVCAEKAADRLETMLLNDLGQQKNRVSNRCSPGYCGWDVVEQKKLFSLLPENFCGVTLSEASLMNQIKSVSGIIGYGPNKA